MPPLEWPEDGRQQDALVAVDAGHVRAQKRSQCGQDREVDAYLEPTLGAHRRSPRSSAYTRYAATSAETTSPNSSAPLIRGSSPSSNANSAAKAANAIAMASRSATSAQMERSARVDKGVVQLPVGAGRVERRGAIGQQRLDEDDATWSELVVPRQVRRQQLHEVAPAQDLRALERRDRTVPVLRLLRRVDHVVDALRQPAAATPRSQLPRAPG